MGSNYRWTTIAIVSTTIGLVVAPVLIPYEVARWYVAAAANAYRADDSDRAERLLTRAATWDADIRDSTDYVLAKLSKEHWNSADEQLDLLEQVIKSNPNLAVEARGVAEEFESRYEFQQAIRAFKLALPTGKPRTAADKNRLAYIRALAGIELDEALIDVRSAIKELGRDPSLLDTEAWVLHAQGHDIEALALMNEAIDKTEKLIGKKPATPPQAAPKVSTAEDNLKSDTQANPQFDSQADSQADSHSQLLLGDSAGTSTPDNASDESMIDVGGGMLDPTSMWPDLEAVREHIDRTKQRLGLEQFTLAVLRFHRLRIYEALGTPVEARPDRRWLHEQNVPVIDQLF